MIGRFLTLLAVRGKGVLAAGVFLGLAWPALASTLAPLMAPSVFVLLATAAVRVDWGEVANHARRPAAPVALIVWILLVSPLVAMGVVALIGPPPALATAIVLMAAAPPIMSSVAFALLLRLDLPLAVIPTFGATLLVPLTLPPLALTLLGLEVEIDVGAFMARLALLAGGAFVVGAVVRRALGPARLEALAPRLDGLSVFVLVVFAIAVMDGVTAALIARPHYVLLTLGAAFLANIALQIAGGLIFLRLGRRRALSAALVSGNRNMALLLAALAGSAPFDVALYFAVGQIPMYMLPAILAPLYRRLL